LDLTASITDAIAGGQANEVAQLHLRTQRCAVEEAMV
jgi:hypothetical protein